MHRACEYLNNIPYINSGGCGIAAYAVFLYLKSKEKSKGFQIVLLHDWMSEDEYHNNLRFIEDAYKTGEPASHVAFTFDGGDTVYDSSGRINVSRYDMLLVPEQRTERYFHTALNDGRWNKRFNRDEYLPLIESELKIQFSL